MVLFSSSQRESAMKIPSGTNIHSTMIPTCAHKMVSSCLFQHLGQKISREYPGAQTGNQTQFVRVAEVKQGALLQGGPKQVWRRPRLWATSVKFFGVFVGCLTIYLVASAIITTWDHSHQGRVKSSWCSCLMVSWRIHFILHHVAVIAYGWMEVEIMCDSLVVLIWYLCRLFQSFCQSERVGSSWL